MLIKGLRKTIPGTVRLWALLAVALLAMAFFAKLGGELLEDGGPQAVHDDLHKTDRAAYDFLIQFKSDGLTQTAIDITSLGSVAVLTLFTVVFLIFLIGVKDKIGIAHLLVAMTGAALWPTLLKNIFGRERPDISLQLVKAGGLSFPSGHSFGAAASYFTFAFFAARYFDKFKLEVTAYILGCTVILLVGLSRIYLGVHYATDVVAGISAGVAWSSLVSAAFFRAYK